jgi:hypothetical protein
MRKVRNSRRDGNCDALSVRFRLRNGRSGCYASRSGRNNSRCGSGGVGRSDSEGRRSGNVVRTVGGKVNSVSSTDKQGGEETHAVAAEVAV